MISEIRFLILCIIIKTPSSVQNCHEVNQSWTLPIHSADGRTTQSGCSGHGKTVLAVMPIGYFIGCRRSSDGEWIEIQANHTNLVAAFLDSVSQGCCVGISGRIRGILNVTAILVDFSGTTDDEDATHPESGRAVAQSPASFVLAFGGGVTGPVSPAIGRCASVIFESHHIEQWEN